MDNAGVDGEIFYTLREAQIVIESWRRHFNTIRPHASFGKPPAPEVFVPAFAVRRSGFVCQAADDSDPPHSFPTL
jgi:hypothetical protein